MKQHLYLKKQHGATLIVGLIMLFLLTIIGMASMNMTTVDVKITANAKDRQLAFIGAESAMFEAGQIIMNTPEEHLDNTTQGYEGKSLQTAGVSWWSDDNNWSLAAVPGTSIQAQHIIEFPVTRKDGIDLTICNIGPACKFETLYPTTVKSSGPGNATVILQSYYAKFLGTPQP